MLRKWSALRAWSVPSARYAEHLTSLCAKGAILHYAARHNFTAACRNFTIETLVNICYNIGESEVHIMSDSKLRTQSMDFAVQIINLVKSLKEKRESIISNQIGRSGTSIGANIREAQYAHGKADFIAKLQIALKEANETGYWLELLYKTNYITESEYKTLDSACTSIRVMLISSITTAKENTKWKSGILLRDTVQDIGNWLILNHILQLKTITRKIFIEKRGKL